MIVVIITILNIIQVILIDDLYINSTICFWSYLILLVIKLAADKKITLISVFIFAFIFMIPPEGILHAKELYSEWGSNNVNRAVEFLILSSSVIILCHNFGYNFINKNYFKRRYKSKKYKVNNRRALFLVLVVYTVSFFILYLPNTLYGLYDGRASTQPFIYSFILNPLSLITIGLWFVYNKGSLISTIIYSSPILISFIGTGTRFLFLYATCIILCGYMVNFKIQNRWRLLLATTIVYSVMSIVTVSRTRGLTNFDSQSSMKIQAESLNDAIAMRGIPQGLIRNIAMITDYTNRNDHTMGRSIGFIGIFWIPRALWPDKPVMLDYWLIREYYSGGFSSGHSTASSYGGEIYMDFGYGISIFLLGFGGLMLSKLQRWIDYNWNSNYRNFILSGFLMGWIFFSVRSPLTATYMLIYVYIFLGLTFRLLLKFNVLRGSESKIEENQSRPMWS